MGQKVNPIGLRLGINRTWDSRWFARKDYSEQLLDDLKLRKFLDERLTQAAVARILIERAAKKTRITIHSARPGVVIGKKGADIDKLRADIAKMTTSEVSLNIVEIRKPEIDAKLIADGIAQQLERRVAFRRAMKRAVQSAMRLGALGIRINCSGRLGGAEIARMEWYREGRVPLHTLRADVDFGDGTAKTTYGTCGVKVWVFKGEILAHDPMAQDKRLAEAQPAGWTPAERRARPRSRRVGIEMDMLSPKRTKYRKAHKGRIHGKAKGGTTLNFGAFGLKAIEPGRVTARQIEAARRAITRHIRRIGRVWIRIFPDVPVSTKPAEVRMGSGKGSPEFWICRVKPGRIMFELDGVPERRRARGVRAGRRQAADRDPLGRARWRGGFGMKAVRASDLRTRTPDELKTSSRRSARRLSTCVSNAPAASSRTPRGCARCGATSPASRPCWASASGEPSPLRCAAAPARTRRTRTKARS